MASNKIVIVLMVFFCTAVNAQVSRYEYNGMQIDATTNCILRYVYFPNMYAYYDKIEKMYIYKGKDEWIKAKSLPQLYGGYSPYSKLAVEITDYDGDEPQQFIKLHKTIYPYSSKGRFKYKTIAVNF